jgi:hypothetical protein
MKKILLLCDNDHFPRGAFRFISQVMDTESIFLKALFFTALNTDNFVPVGFIPVGVPYMKLKEEEKLSLDVNRKKFSKECEQHGIRYMVHSNEDCWDVDLFTRESRFADLVVLSEELFYQEVPDIQPNYFIEEALRSSECPVVIVPEKFQSIDRLAFAYDGGRESMFALRQFSSLFPGLTELPAEFVHVKNEESQDIPDQELLKEYTCAHYDAQFVTKLHFDPKKYFTTWLESKKNVFLVAGAYSRSSLSNLFKQSFADKIIAEHTCPVFISHFS